MCLDRLDVEEAEPLRGGDDTDVPVPFLCRGDQLADGGGSGGADDDLQERFVGLITHAGTPSWRLTWCSSGGLHPERGPALGDGDVPPYGGRADLVQGLPSGSSTCTTSKCAAAVHVLCSGVGGAGVGGGGETGPGASKPSTASSPSSSPPTDEWTGEPENREPRKHAQVCRVDAGAIPEEFVDTTAGARHRYLAGGPEVALDGWQEKHRSFAQERMAPWEWGAAVVRPAQRTRLALHVPT